jgi:hypothetical protein
MAEVVDGIGPTITAKFYIGSAACRVKKTGALRAGTVISLADDQSAVVDGTGVTLVTSECSKVFISPTT